MSIGFYLAVAVLLFAFEVAYLVSANRLNIVDRPHHQSSHSGVVIRGGGVVFYVAFSLWALLNGIPSVGGYLGITILAIISFVDDIRSVNPLIRLVCQFIAIILMFYHSGLIQAPWYAIILLVTACVGALNIYNFMDGINGMTGGYSLVVSIALLYANEHVVHFVDVNLLVFVVMSLFVFNFFNYRAHAKCFAGDVGSLSMGFIIVFLVLRLALRGQTMSWMAFLAVYLVDGGMTLLHRLFLRENLLKPHKKHAYQIMANELRMPHLVVSGIYMGLQAVCCGVYVAWPGYPAFFTIFCVLIVTYLLFMRKYYYLHNLNH